MTNQVQWSGITEPVSWPPVAEHTPGPWEAPRNGLDGAVYAPNAPAGTLWRITDRVHGLSHEEIAANALLIAAAPELLVLAKQYAADCPICKGTGLVSIHFPGNEGVPEWDADDQPCQECVDIRAVIAKAEGRS